MPQLKVSVPSSKIFDILTTENGTDTLFRNEGNKPPIDAAQYSR